MVCFGRRCPTLGVEPNILAVADAAPTLPDARPTLPPTPTCRGRPRATPLKRAIGGAELIVGESLFGGRCTLAFIVRDGYLTVSKGVGNVVKFDRSLPPTSADPRSRHSDRLVISISHSTSRVLGTLYFAVARSQSPVEVYEVLRGR